jgi:DNA-directed RNA polymerase II subunit RPB1
MWNNHDIIIFWVLMKEYHGEISKIKSVQFGLLSSDEIRSNSVVEIKTRLMFDEKGQPVVNGLFDPRMGVTSQDDVCTTDFLSSKETPGYFGHYELGIPVYNHAHLSVILDILTVNCIYCSNCLVEMTDDETKFIMSLPCVNRLSNLKDLLKKKNEKQKQIKCTKCGTDQPQKYILNDNALDQICLEINKTKTRLLPEYVERVMQRINTKTLNLMGFDFELSHPHRLVIHTIPICPPMCRPSVGTDDKITEDHITSKYISIMSNNEKTLVFRDNSNPKYLENYREFLQYDIATLSDNTMSRGIVPSEKIPGRADKTFGQRLRGNLMKMGRIRMNLMSRRVNFSSRSVITPDPCLSLNEIGVPKSIAMTITYPEKVTKLNISILQDYVKNGPNIYPGAVEIHQPNSRVVRVNESSVIFIGDIVVRHLCEGDVVLLNRQPTLHKLSMMAHRVRIFDGNSFRLNVNVTPPYNADFDGDEMVMHCPQSIATKIELETIMGLEHHCMSPASTEPAIHFVQDNVLSAFLLSDDSNAFSAREFMNIVSHGALYYYGNLKHKSVLTGKDAIDYYTHDSVTEGIHNKTSLMNAIKTSYHENGKDGAYDFINSTQKLFIEYLTKKNFSISPNDLQLDAKIQKTITEKIKEIEVEINEYTESIIMGNNGQVTAAMFDDHVMTLLTTVTQFIENLIADSDMSKFMKLIKSGSKGKKKNMSQMKGLLGQQIVNKTRIQNGLTDRTLPHYRKYHETIQSRGFVKTSFRTGLNPVDFFFHCGGGREGLIEQALQTGQSGYLERKMIKTMEDITARSNGFVSDAQGNVIQMLYGDDGCMGECIEEQRLLVCDANYNLSHLEQSHSLNDDLLPFVNNFESNDENTELCLEYFKDLRILRNKFLKNLSKNNQHLNTNDMKQITLKHAVNINKKIEIALRHHSYSKENKTDLNPYLIIQSYKQLIASCRQSHLNSGTDMLKLLLYANAGPKMLICEKRMSIPAFIYFIKDVEKSFLCTRIESGEMVGIISAQSLGEPSTQLALNSFHFAGSGRAQGLPRLQELLNSQTELEGASTSIYLKPPHCYILQDATDICSELNQVLMKDVILETELVYGNNNIIVEDYHRLIDVLSLPKQPDSWILRIDFKLHVKTDSNILDNIWELLYKDVAGKKVFSHPIIRSLNKDILVKVNLENLKLNKKRIDGQVDFMSEFVRELDKYLFNLTVSGISNICHVQAVQKENIWFDKELEQLCTERSTYLTADGTNLKELFVNPAVDATMTRSDNVIDTFNTIGVEAARHILIEELLAVLREVASDLDKRHVDILVDKMLSKGRLESVGSIHKDKGDSGPFDKASFEKIVENFQRAALYAEKDFVQGISSNIILGHAPPCGTGLVNVSLDEHAFAIIDKSDKSDIKSNIKSNIKTKSNQNQEFDRIPKYSKSSRGKVPSTLNFTIDDFGI